MKTTLFVLIGVFSVAVSANANIANGSFETTDYFVGYGCGNIAACYFGNNGFPHGPDAFAPWTFTSADPGGSGVALVGSAVGEPGPADGDQYAFLSGVSTISQLFTSSAGQKETLTFLLASRTNCCDNGESLSVLVDGSTYLVLPNNSALAGVGWQQYSVSFTGTGATSRLTFESAGTAAVLLDKVAVTPEPGLYAALALGLGSLLGFRHFRAKRSN